MKKTTLELVEIQMLFCFFEVEREWNRRVEEKNFHWREQKI